MPEMKWIPIKERLPDEEGYYICTSKWEWNPAFTRYTEPFEVKALYFGKIDMEVLVDLFGDRLFKDGSYGFGEESDGHIINPEIVLAWMPFPEVYKE